MVSKHNILALLICLEVNFGLVAVHFCLPRKAKYRHVWYGCQKGCISLPSNKIFATGGLDSEQIEELDQDTFAFESTLQAEFLLLTGRSCSSDP